MRQLTAAEKYEVWLALVAGEVSQNEAADRWGVDRSTVTRIRVQAKDGAMAALAASRPDRPRDQAVPELEAARAEVQRLSARRSRSKPSSCNTSQIRRSVHPAAQAWSRGTVTLSELSEDFRERLLAVEPGLSDFTFSAESYDAAAVLALAAAVAGTDDSRAIADEIVGVTREGEPCETVAACLELVAAGEDIDYGGGERSAHLRRPGPADDGELRHRRIRRPGGAAGRRLRHGRAGRLVMTRTFDLWGVPFDGGATLGWPGARYAPDQVRAALAWMRMRLEDGRVWSLDTDRLHDVDPQLMHHRGDVDVVAHDLAATVEGIAAAVASSVREGHVPLVIGGDDCVFYPAVRGFHDAVEGSVAVIHFDAHLDIMDENRQQGRLSQSSGMRRSAELPQVALDASTQVGPRHLNFPSSHQVVQEMGLEHVTAVQFDELGAHAVVDRVLDRIAPAGSVFFSFDIDTIDPAFAPGAGAHEPGGLTSRQALDCVRLLAPHCDGFAVTEVNPLRDVGDMTSTLAGYLFTRFALHGAERAR